VSSLPFARAPRVVLSREVLWRTSVPVDATERNVLQDRTGHVVLSTYAVYSDAATTAEFDAVVAPVLRALASSRSRCMLVLAETMARFDAGRVRHALQVAHDLGISTLVEIGGTWGQTLLELLAAAGPSYVRLAPELVHDAANVPDVFRSLVQLSEFARDRTFQLVARNPRDEHDLDAARAAGIGLLQWAAVPLEPLADSRVTPTSLFAV